MCFPYGSIRLSAFYSVLNEIQEVRVNLFEMRSANSMDLGELVEIVAMYGGADGAMIRAAPPFPSYLQLPFSG